MSPQHHFNDGTWLHLAAGISEMAPEVRSPDIRAGYSRIRQLLSIDASGRPKFQRLRNRAVKEFMMALGCFGDELGQLDLMPLTKGI